MSIGDRQKTLWAMVGLVLLLGCDDALDRTFCGVSGCELSEEDWSKLSLLADLPATAPVDRSNRYFGVPLAEGLGQKFFYDARFSGNATQIDTLRRPAAGRAAKGQPVTISCATCHDPNRAGTDVTSQPGNVSIGAGQFDVNAQPTVNAAFYTLAFWNGRADSLWAQAMAANEGGVSMNSDRLHNVWVMADVYRGDYQTTFAPAMLPMAGKSADVTAIVETDGARAGQCKIPAGSCPTELGCRVPDGNPTACWPRFPLHGKPGTKAGCQAGDAAEPFGDAWDCMAKDDQQLIMRAFVNWAKAIAAYEAKLISRDSAFDQFIHEGADSTAISLSAKRGARLFVGKAACTECHGTPLFSDNSFHNVGTPQVGAAVPTEADCPAGGVCDCVETPARTGGDGVMVPAKEAKNCLPWGARDGFVKLRGNLFLRDSVWSDDMADDSRKYLVDQARDRLETVPRGAWRTPTLRDVALTAPYMHNGVYRSLEEVVAHYNAGGSSNGVAAPAAQLRPLFLSMEEQRDLVEFLKTLTGSGVPVELRTPPVLP
ncbi:MAG TPA: cytochrome c peroxidase [Polyangia bacterium]|jgi:cytochrome c peroxidase|nr:cytochrome c peroxidase [Polyangia bacterium]